MPGERTNTPRFRVTLSVVFIWLAGTIAAAGFKLESVTPYNLRQGYSEAQSRCGLAMPDPPSRELFRAATSEELHACFNWVDATYRAQEASQTASIMDRWATWALAPGVLTLLLAAYWIEVIEVLRGRVAAYAEWVRGGSGNSNGRA